MQASSTWDVFISHASEDKDAIARPLAHSLREMGISVWYDEFSLTAGDSLSKSINHGLSNSKFGIVIVSRKFLEKKWTQRELAGLFAKEDEEKVIIPIWHEVTRDIVTEYSPILADRVALKSSDDFGQLTIDLLRAMNLPFRGAELSGVWYGPTGRLRLFEADDLIVGDYDWNGRDWGAHLRGRITKDVFVFDWWWDFTPERGGGYFNYNGDILDGEWWISVIASGEPSDNELHNDRRNPWGYRRVSDVSDANMK